MEMDMVSKAFEQAFVSVSQKLLGLQLQRRKQDNGIFLQQPVRADHDLYEWLSSYGNYL